MEIELKENRLKTIDDFFIITKRISVGQGGWATRIRNHISRYFVMNHLAYILNLSIDADSNVYIKP